MIEKRMVVPKGGNEATVEEWYDTETGVAVPSPELYTGYEVLEVPASPALIKEEESEEEEDIEEEEDE